MQFYVYYYFEIYHGYTDKWQIDNCSTDFTNIFMATLTASFYYYYYYAEPSTFSGAWFKFNTIIKRDKREY